MLNNYSEFTCDNCSTEIRRPVGTETPTGWFRLTRKERGPSECVNEDHFCSDDCLHAYVISRSEETNDKDDTTEELPESPALEA